MNKTEHPRIRIEFDGGTPCNIPAKGYGIGYGSYRINGNPVTRISHGIPCSNNAAEILTLVAAFAELRSEIHYNPHIDVYGDSQITLRWLDRCAGSVISGKSKKPKGSPEFLDAIQKLAKAVLPFYGRVTTHWQPREHSVATFGH